MDRYELRRLDYSLSEDHQALQAAYKDFFATRCPIETVRAAEESGFDKNLWERLCAMGATTMAVPESAGGDGATLVDLTLVAEEIERSLAPRTQQYMHVAERSSPNTIYHARDVKG